MAKMFDVKTIKGSSVIAKIAGTLSTQANPSFFIDGKTMPVLATVLGTFDLFLIWGWILAAIGLQKVGKLSGGSAWTIVLILTLIGLTFRVVSALFSGNAT